MRYRAGAAEACRRRRRSPAPLEPAGMTSIAALNAADREAFVAAVGFAFEESPWIAAAAWERRPFADRAALFAELVGVVAEAPAERQVALIAAHPDLAGRVAREGRLTPASRGEQAAAGLDRLTDAQRARFEAANAAYRARFGFPFVICAREHDADGILSAMERRVTHDRPTEITTALREITSIARLRLEDAVAG
jgi:2-oxo-4-hydroxy-4-carboxy-5-ureidoimidazoline decarboxylase